MKSRGRRFKSIINLTSGCSTVGSARLLGSRGRRFKSCHPDHSINDDRFRSFFLCCGAVKTLFNSGSIFFADFSNNSTHGYNSTSIKVWYNANFFRFIYKFQPVALTFYNVYAIIKIGCVF